LKFHLPSINLRLILVSGKTKEFLFSPNDSAADIAKHVYDNWPMDWEEEQVSSPNILRLIYQGRFLHGNVTLGGMKVIFIIHATARQRNEGKHSCCPVLSQGYNCIVR
uniref:Ubiquitin-like domain-containing protein n=1 Tax=Pavo cristatus TaxID=9049 RepID=A0A8C9LA93_PAVCR